MQRLRAEIDRLQLTTDAAVNETRALKVQLDERLLVNATSPSNATVSRFIYVELIACLIRSL
jgi:hypothetical protein